MTYEGDDRRGKSEWHFNKSISIAEIITLLSIVAAAILMYAQLTTQTALLRTDVEYLKQSDVKIEATLHEDVKDIKAAMLRMEQKMEGMKK